MIIDPGAMPNCKKQLSPFNSYYFLTSVLDVRIHLGSSPEEDFSVAGDIQTEIYVVNHNRRSRWWYSQQSQKQCAMFLFPLVLKGLQLCVCFNDLLSDTPAGVEGQGPAQSVPRPVLAFSIHPVLTLMSLRRRHRRNRANRSRQPSSFSSNSS